MEKEEFYYSDFTEKNYREMLKYAKNRGEILSTYEDFLEGHVINPMIWRHDIDFSINRAVKLATIEAQEGVSAIYFVHFNSYYYNAFEKENIERIKKIVSMGHQIGIHLDCTVYDEIDEAKLARDLLFYKGIMYRLYDVKVNTFSFHNPSKELLEKCNRKQYAGLYNAYAEDIMKRLAYCSDSNGYWRFQRLEDFLKTQYFDKDGICVLTHPVWWTPEVLSPKQRVLRAIEGRAKAVEDCYDKTLQVLGRKNVT